MAGIVTGLVVQERNKERVNVFIDGEFAFGLAMIEALKLRKGQRLGEEEIARLKALDEIEVAHEAALRFLSYRPRSVQEVRRKLAEKKISPEAVEMVIARLQEAGLLDDEAFARYWLENRDQFGPRSGRALRYELRLKGVADSIIRDVLADVDESDAAYRAGRTQARRLADLDRKTFSKRLGDHLVRRGFGYNTVREVVNRLWGEVSRDDGGTESSENIDEVWRDE